MSPRSDDPGCALQPVEVPTMNTLPTLRLAPPHRRRTRLMLLALCLATLPWTLPAHAGMAIGNNPLYLVSGKANVLVVLDNSNSMDEDASGAAVGSNSPNSKSEVARGVVRTLTDNYKNRIHMGLMRYKQNNPSGSYLHNSPYDASYDPATYDPVWAGARNSATNKRFRIANPTSAGNHIHYNVALPFYAGSNQGNAFCYSPTSVPFFNGENPATGPWDSYRCFRTKTGTSNTLPAWGNAASEAAQGYATNFYNGALSPTDSDFAQGILDFGKQLTWNYVGRTWLRNDSPGRGYLEVPIKSLTDAQGTAIKTKLACNIPGDPAPCTASGVKNAGLTPIEGTLLTAKDYFGGAWNDASEGYVASCYPLPTSCGKNFVILLTDGLPSTDKSGGLVANPATALAQAAAAAEGRRRGNLRDWLRAAVRHRPGLAGRGRGGRRHRQRLQRQRHREPAGGLQEDLRRHLPQDFGLRCGVAELHRHQRRQPRLPGPLRQHRLVRRNRGLEAVGRWHAGLQVEHQRCRSLRRAGTAQGVHAQARYGRRRVQAAGRPQRHAAGRPACQRVRRRTGRPRYLRPGTHRLDARRQDARGSRRALAQACTRAGRHHQLVALLRARHGNSVHRIERRHAARLRGRHRQRTVRLCAERADAEVAQADQPDLQPRVFRRRRDRGLGPQRGTSSSAPWAGVARPCTRWTSPTRPTSTLPTCCGSTPRPTWASRWASH